LRKVGSFATTLVQHISHLMACRAKTVHMDGVKKRPRGHPNYAQGRHHFLRKVGSFATNLVQHISHLMACRAKTVHMDGVKKHPRGHPNYEQGRHPYLRKVGTLICARSVHLPPTLCSISAT